jgi:hypothetical protein
MNTVDHTPYLEASPYEADGGQKIGVDPRRIPVELLRARIGHEGRALPETPLDAIRGFCIECSGGSPAEVRKCTTMKCPLWPFRMNSNPFHARAKQREDGNAQLRALRTTSEQSR